MSKLKKVLKKILPNGIIYKLKDVINFFNNKKMLKKHKTVKKYVKGKYPYGINLIGDIQAETGLGQSMRIIASILKANEIPFVIIQMNQPGNLKHNNHEWDNKISDKAIYGVNLIHINASEWAENYNMLSTEILDYRFNIAYWLWELETFPKKWQPCILTVDEIWAPSEFICRCLRKYADDIDIRKVPYVIDIKEPVKYKREHFKLPEDKFLFLIMYDLKSISERKNPEGMIEAFKKAFSVDTANSKDIGLVLKINHVDDENNLNIYKQKLEGYNNIYFITENLSREEVEALEAEVDVLISLHRSEGFGLPPAEAMYLGTPVISTNWSATTEFMDEKTACLVDYSMITLDKKIGPYEKGNCWADADVGMAAAYIKRLYEDKAYYNDIRDKACKHIRECLNVNSIGNNIKEYLSKIE